MPSSRSTPDARSISILETLALLDGDFSHVREGVLNRDYTFWIGSGISLGRAASVTKFLMKVLEFLQARAASDPEGAHAEALAKIISIGRAAGFKGAIDVATVPTAWKNVNKLTSALWGRYSAVLDVSVAGELDDYLVWDAIDVAHDYVDSLQPDVEHLALAILFAEGVIAQAHSANWDALIEKAEEQLDIPATSRAKVAIRGEDFRGPSPRARLLKFHGCARLAAAEPDGYRGYLVARETQIERWSVDDDHKIMRERMQTSAVASRSLFIGLSAQDVNIRWVFNAAAAVQAWDAATNIGVAVFAEDSLNDEQVKILKQVYKDSYTPNRASVEAGAELRAYAKQLLVALVLEVWEAKLHAVLIRMEGMPGSTLGEIANGLRAVRDRLADLALKVHDIDRFTMVVGIWSQLVRLFRAGDRSSSPRYAMISNSTPDEFAADPNALAASMDFLALSIGVLGTGVARSGWSLGTSADGQVIIESQGVARKVTIVSNGSALARAMLDGLDLDDPNSIVMLAEPIPNSVRSPGGRYGRTGDTVGAIVTRADLVENASNADSLVAAIREAGLIP